MTDPATPDPATPDALPRSARRVHRLLSLGHELTRKRIAHLTHRDARTASRVVAALRSAGVPVAQRRDGRETVFFLAPEHQDRRLALDLDEDAVLALTVAAEAARPALVGTPLEPALARAAAAVREAALALDDGAGPDTFDPDADPHRWHFGTAGVAPLDPAVFATLRRAVADGLRVRVDYTNAQGTFSPRRQLSPLALAPVRGAWVLAAWCHTRSALRDFNLSRVSHATPLSAAAHQPDGFDARAFFGKRWGALEGEAPVEVVLHVAPERAVYFRSRRYHGSQTVEAAPGGGLVVRYHVPGGDALDELRAFVASWGPHVVALAPPSLAARLADDARATAERYAQDENTIE